MTIKMLGDRVLIRTESPESISKAGVILVPKDAPPSRGTVVAVGPGVYSPKGEFIPTTVKVGDVVLFSKNVGEVIELHEEKLLALTEGLIMGVVS